MRANNNYTAAFEQQMSVSKEKWSWAWNWTEIDVEWLQMDNMRNCSQTMFAHLCKVERSNVDASQVAIEHSEIQEKLPILTTNNELKLIWKLWKNFDLKVHFDAFHFYFVVFDFENFDFELFNFEL